MADKLRQAAQMALEAGEKSMSAMRGLYGGWRCGTAIAATEAAITALREALAEQPTPAAVAVPDGWKLVPEQRLKNALSLVDRGLLVEGQEC